MRTIFTLIKWSFKTMLFLLGVSPLFKCSSGYRESDGKVSFNGREITDTNFVVLSKVFAKDATDAYYKEKAITHADVTSFEVLDDHYAKDKSKVYYCDEYREGQNYYLTKKQTVTIIEDAMPASFVSLGNGFAKDSRRAFIAYKSFAVKDIASFKSIDAVFSKDTVQAYYNFKPITGSDGNSFEVINTNYAKDKSHIYFYGFSNEVKSGPYIISCDKASFSILGYPYSKDTSSVFYENEKMSGVDAASFQLIRSRYSKDKNGVYFRTKKIEGADAASFIVPDENDQYSLEYCFATDKNGVYWKDKKVAGANTGFKILGLDYGSDQDHIFYKTILVKVADVKSFKVYPHGFGDADAEDAKNKYYQGKIVKVD